MSDKVGMRNEMYRSVGGERGEASPTWRGGEASLVQRKAKHRRCEEIEVYGGNNFRNRYEWFVSASVVNGLLGLCSDWQHAQSVVMCLKSACPKSVLELACLGGFISAVQVVLESACSRIVANRCEWFLSVTNWILINDGYRNRHLVSFGIGVGWVLLGMKVKA